MGDRNDQTLMDKSMRSVFVGNIPYEATEEKLKDIFCEVGPVLSLKLVFDRESGKPKGYGFCEYKDQETAQSAMRNLNGYEFGGRALRVDNACTEKSRMEMAALLQGPQVENPYGDECSPQETPDIIAKIVTRLQPDQMYEIMRQAKVCLQNDPVEARTMLLENPQLTYGLLQAAVVMSIIDAGAAPSFLHPRHNMPPVLTEEGPVMVGSNHRDHHLHPAVPPFASEVNRHDGGPRMGSNFHDTDERHLHNDRMGGPQPMPTMDTDLRMMDPFMAHRMPEVAAVGPSIADPFAPIDPRQQQQSQHQRPVDPRLMKDPRLEGASASKQASVAGPVASMDGLPERPNLKPSTADASDQEKAALIMQVLQLSDEQIALLPQDQRASILVLKEQISRNAQK